MKYLESMRFNVYLEGIIFNCPKRFEAGLLLYFCSINIGFQERDLVVSTFSARRLWWL